jgi:hypothetical protein
MLVLTGALAVIGLRWWTIRRFIERTFEDGAP